MSRYESGPATRGMPAAASSGDKPEAHSVAWRTSSFCQTGECVEVGTLDGMILVRDSKDPGPVLSYSAAEFRAFALGIRAGEYDDLIATAGS